jgi:hypothetical protein
MNTLAALLALAAIYVFVATLICSELPADRPHWWCPACRLGFFRRML